ncbi:ArpU family phage packaging/lysis transcriptional regulator [Bacillus cereus]|uniref:ArpU family phage packaging/lysis transcriptional regulator n=1 Tax=Bacillus cereus TaxID=1396 RepID=UPI0011457DFB|nr:ArpU family phage packaging/lysis transcriptional regulator [Bacillus cereus]
MSEALKLDLNIKEIDERATVKQSLRALEKYRMLMLSVDDEYLPKVTATYSLTPPSNTNEFHSSTENVIEFVDRERERDTYMSLLRKGINRIPVESRELIVKKYMGRDELYDFEVYNQMGISKPHFDRKKRKALINLACSLKIEVYQ